MGREIGQFIAAGAEGGRSSLSHPVIIQLCAASGCRRRTRSALRRRPGAESQVRPDFTYTKRYNLLACGEHGLPPGCETVWAEAKLADIARLHRLIDLEVAAAYGWPGDLEDQALVAALRLNVQGQPRRARRCPPTRTIGWAR
jgi:hypothetical protein